MSDNTNGLLYLEKIHLGRGLKSSSVESYSKHLNSLNKLDVRRLKFYFHIYKEVLSDVEEILDSKNLLDTMKQEELEHKKICLEDDKIKRYISGRIKEEDLSIYVDSEWLERIKEMKEALFIYDLNEKIDIYLKGRELMKYIEFFLIKRDEYWYPYDEEVLYRMKSIGFKFEKASERIWQPKTS